MLSPRAAVAAWLTRWASGLRFPALLAITASLFLIDLLVPDLVPLADEVLLGLVTLLLATWRKRKVGASAATVEVEPLRDRGGTPPSAL